jgi:putative peptidoglycan lipid II flippase
MNFRKPLPRFARDGGLLAVLTLGIAGLFKITAFGREAFIASWFGLSSVTDAYFAFQQLPVMLAAFMFGAFALAFAPIYADEKRKNGQVEWLPGLTVYGGMLGILLTLLIVVSAPWLLSAFGMASAAQGKNTLVILSCSFVPVIWLGIWAGAAVADGRNLLAMFVAGLPYLAMTALLAGIYVVGKLDALSLPLSFMAGFGLIGLCMLPYLVSAQNSRTYLCSVIDTWKMPGFHRLLRQLGASSIENLGYSANQLLLVYFVAQEGTGAISANTCAARVGMIGFSLLSQPLAQLLQAKLCAAPDDARPEMFKKWLPLIMTAVFGFGAFLYLLHAPITSLIYLHGKFSVLELSEVTEIIPAWIAYFLVVSLNAIAARYLFTTGRGNHYVRRQLWAYGSANLIRVALWGRLNASTVVWCSVFCEGCALVMNLRSCFQQTRPAVLEPVLAGAQEI